MSIRWFGIRMEETPVWWLKVRRNMDGGWHIVIGVLSLGLLLLGIVYAVYHYVTSHESSPAVEPDVFWKS